MSFTQKDNDVIMHQLPLLLDQDSIDVQALLDALEQLPPHHRILAPTLVAYEINQCRPVEEIITDRETKPFEIKRLLDSVHAAISHRDAIINGA